MNPETSDEEGFSSQYFGDRVMRSGWRWWWFVLKPAADEIAGIESMVREKLFDPESARFRNIKLYWTRGVGCGEVNAKNKMGGYVGYTTFIVFDKWNLRFQPASDDRGEDAEQRRKTFDTLQDSNCREKAPS